MPRPRHRRFRRRQGTKYERARELCAGCSVRHDCLDFAMADAELRGMWSGTSEQERQKIRRRQVA